MSLYSSQPSSFAVAAGGPTVGPPACPVNLAGGSWQAQDSSSPERMFDSWYNATASGIRQRREGSGMPADLLSLLIGSIPIYIAKDPGGFRLALLIGLVLAALCWYICSVYARSWNRRFHIRFSHHVLCAFASILTLFFAVIFPALAYTKEAALASIDLWKYQLNLDSPWAAATFARAYEEVKRLGIEDFSRVPPPGAPNSFIPTNHDESRQVAALAYANEACRHFDDRRPFLSKVVWSSPGVPSRTIFNDVHQWHQTNPNYPPSRAIEIAAGQIRQGLEPQVPRVVYLSRIAVLILFALVQAVPFGLIGWAAYRDIKVRL